MSRPRSYQRILRSLSADQAASAMTPSQLELLAAAVDSAVGGYAPSATVAAQLTTLDNSPEWAELYEALYTVMALEPQDQLSHPPTAANFDLSFLTNAATPTAAGIWRQLGDAYRLSVQLTSELGDQFLRLTNLDALLLPHHQLLAAPQMRNLATASLPMLELQALPHLEQNTKIVLYMGPVQNGEGTLIVQVLTNEPEAPIAQAVVKLSDEAGTLLERISTAADGRVTFQGLTPAQYLIQVLVSATSWEIQIDLVPKNLNA